MPDDYNAREWSTDDERCSEDDFLCRICGSESASSICHQCDLVRKDGEARIEDVNGLLEAAREAHAARWDGDTLAVLKKTRRSLRDELASFYLAATGERL